MARWNQPRQRYSERGWKRGGGKRGGRRCVAAPPSFRSSRCAYKRSRLTLTADRLENVLSGPSAAVPRYDIWMRRAPRSLIPERTGARKTDLKQASPQLLQSLDADGLTIWISTDRPGPRTAGDSTSGYPRARAEAPAWRAPAAVPRSIRPGVDFGATPFRTSHDGVTSSRTGGLGGDDSILSTRRPRVAVGQPRPRVRALAPLADDSVPTPDPTTSICPPRARATRSSSFRAALLRRSVRAPVRITELRSPSSEEAPWVSATNANIFLSRATARASIRYLRIHEVRHITDRQPILSMDRECERARERRAVPRVRARASSIAMDRLRAWKHWRWLRDAGVALVAIVGIRAYQHRECRAARAPRSTEWISTAGRVARELPRKPVVLHFWANWCGVVAPSSTNRRARSQTFRCSPSPANREARATSQPSSRARHHAALMVDEASTLALRLVSRVPSTSSSSTRAARIRHVEVGYTSELGLRWRAWLGRGAVGSPTAR